MNNAQAVEWYVESDGEGPYVVQAGGYGRVATIELLSFMRDGATEDWANAHLVAVAPILLEIAREWNNETIPMQERRDAIETVLARCKYSGRMQHSPWPFRMEGQDKWLYVCRADGTRILSLDWQGFYNPEDRTRLVNGAMIVVAPSILAVLRHFARGQSSLDECRDMLAEAVDRFDAISSGKGV